jgi:type II secretory ATPase GspE/PulE/Tfp pilus assembly ATPase PilB-like protein
VHPHFLATSLLGCVAQRLVRTLCPQCKLSFEGTDSTTFDEVRPWLVPGEGESLYGAAGCAACHQTGYAARTGVFEVLVVSKPIRKLVMAKQPAQTIRNKAVEEGMIEFRQAALLKMARGETTVEEVFRVVPSEYLSVED